MPRATSGFCVYNDLAVAISWLLANGAERIAYVDVDVHHGDGVQQIFYHDPRVLTISLHETPAVLFPGTGFPYEIGGPDALGSAVNVALPAGTGDSGWLRAFHAVVPQALRAFQPQILVTQHGCDSHQHDPLADLELTVDGQRASYLALAELADELCEGRWVSTGGGGYSITNVVPRAWTHLLAIVGGQPLSPETPTPQEWRDELGAPTADGDDRRRRGQLHRLRERLQSDQPVGPGDPRDPQGGLPRARSRPRLLRSGRSRGTGWVFGGVVSVVAAGSSTGRAGRVAMNLL